MASAFNIGSLNQSLLHDVVMVDLNEPFLIGIVDCSFKVFVDFLFPKFFLYISDYAHDPAYILVKLFSFLQTLERNKVLFFFSLYLGPFFLAVFGTPVFACLLRALFGLHGLIVVCLVLAVIYELFASLAGVPFKGALQGCIRLSPYF